MLDVIIIGKENLNEQVSVIDLGVADHLAQVIKINTDLGNIKLRNKKNREKEIHTKKTLKYSRIYYIMNHGRKFVVN